jgi:hypothetical protein
MNINIECSKEGIFINDNEIELEEELKKYGINFNLIKIDNL